MSFKVETDNLRSQAEEWGKRADNADTVRASISEGVGAGYDFGFLAGGAGVEGMYDDWTRAMDDALRDCAYSARYLEAALASTAADYDETDATRAQSAARLDRMLEDSGYSS
jgi:hypothetical protein